MTAPPVILFDGVCNLCNGVVNFVIRQDKKGVLKFAALQSDAGQQLLKNLQLPQKDFETFLLVQNHQIYDKSTAALLVAKHLPWYWQWVSLFWLVPKSFRDKIYELIARNRYRWFGKEETCMIPAPHLMQRFITDTSTVSSSNL